MGKAKSSSTSKRGRRPLTPEARENQLIALSMDRAEEQLRDGTASSQIIVHFLKLGTAKAELEKEKIRHENKLLEAKTDALESGKEMKALYEDAIKAMKTYSGNGDPDEY